MLLGRASTDASLRVYSWIITVGTGAQRLIAFRYAQVFVLAICVGEKSCRPSKYRLAILHPTSAPISSGNGPSKFPCRHARQCVRFACKAGRRYADFARERNTESA